MNRARISHAVAGCGLLLLLAASGCAQEPSYGQLKEGEVVVGTAEFADGVVATTEAIEDDPHVTYFQTIHLPNGDKHEGYLDEKGRRHMWWKYFPDGVDPDDEIRTWWWEGQQVSLDECLQRTGYGHTMRFLSDEKLYGKPEVEFYQPR